MCRDVRISTVSKLRAVATPATNHNVFAVISRAVGEDLAVVMRMLRKGLNET